MEKHLKSVLTWGVLLTITLFFLGDYMLFYSAAILAIIARFIMLFSLERRVLLTVFVTLPFAFKILVNSGLKMVLPSDVLLIILFLIFIYNLIEMPIHKLLFFLKGIKNYTLVASNGFFLLTIAISTYFSSIPTWSVKFALDNLLFVSVGFGYTSLALLQNKISIRELIIASTIGLSLTCLYTIIHSLFLGVGRNVAAALPKPLYNDHTHLAATLLLVVPLVFYLWKTETQSRLKKVYALTFLLFVVVLLISYCRASWLGALLMITICVVWFLKIKTSIILVSLSCFLFFIGLNTSKIVNYFQINQSDSSRLEAGLADQIKSVTNITSDVSNLERLNRWKCAIRMGLEKPFVGYGPGTYQIQYLPFQRENELTRISVKSHFYIKEGRGGTAHSEYLLSFSESGFPGLISWLFLISSVLYTFFSFYRGVSNKDDLFLAQMCFIGLIGYFVHAFFNNFLDSANFAIYFWFIVGLLALLSARNRMAKNA